jgi:digeranylgeranylglycerophospholipid reductase
LYDLIIVGGGIAGSSAAKVASEKGLKVVIIEKEESIISPPKCAEGVFSTKFRVFFNPRSIWINSIINSGELIGPEGRKLKINYPNGGYILDRTVFDVDLQREAERKGTEFLYNCRATELSEEANNIVVGYVRNNGKKGIVKGKFLIGADGPVSFVGRRTGLIDNTYNDLYLCYQYKVYIRDLFCSDKIYFYVDQLKMPYGYGWIFPKSGGLYNIGVATIYKYSKKKPKELLDEWIKNINSYDYEIFTAVYGVVPIGFRRLYNERRVLLIGDAGSLADTFTGEGICNAVRSGRWAGEAVYNYLSSGDRTDINNFYIAPVNKYILQVNKRLYMIRNLFYKLSQNQIISIMDNMKDLIDDRNFKDLDMMEILYNLLIKNPFPLISSFWRRGKW